MNRLTMTVIITALLATGSMANAASCKYKVNEVDLFTKEKLVSTEWYSMTSAMSSAFKILVDNRTSIFVSGISEGDQNFIAIKLRMNDGASQNPSNEDMRDALLVEEGSPLTITLEDGTEIILHARKSVRGNTRHGYSGGNSVVESNIVVHYPIEADDINALLEQNASLVSVSAIGGRYSFVGSNGQVSFEMNRKGRDRFIDALTCLNKG